jgi:Family of unknown function (DUF6677)
MRLKPTHDMARRSVEEEQTAAKPKIASSRLFWICVAAGFIPGLGHYLLGRRWRALIFFVCIVAMFVLGLAMKGTFFTTGSGSVLHTLGYFGELSSGILMPVAKFFGYAGGDPYFISSDYGTAYLVSAGMLNILTILDAFDIAMERKP